MDTPPLGAVAEVMLREKEPVVNDVIALGVFVETVAVGELVGAVVKGVVIEIDEIAGIEVFDCNTGWIGLWDIDFENVLEVGCYGRELDDKNDDLQS